MNKLLLIAPALALTACASSQVAATTDAPVNPPGETRTNTATRATSSAKSATTTAAPTTTSAVSTTTVVLTSEVQWQQLNPARGDKSPEAGTLWGDRNGSEATGFLLRPKDGFESPPHVHNVSYRGVVIRGLVHNADPDTPRTWMPAGYFWTEPAGHVHITAAMGSDTLAYIEIEQGPYRVLPVDKAFDRGERFVNVDASNLVWLDASSLTWLKQPGQSVAANGPKLAFLWGSPESDRLSGTLVKLPAGSPVEIRNHGPTFGAVMIQGRAGHQVPGATDVAQLEPGSYFSSQGQTVNQVSCEAGAACILYVRSKGRFDVSSAVPHG